MLLGGARGGDRAEKADVHAPMDSRMLVCTGEGWRAGEAGGEDVGSHCTVESGGQLRILRTDSKVEEWREESRSE